MSTKAKQSQTARLARVQRAIAGLQKYLASSPSMVMAAVTYTPAQLQSLLQGYAPTITALQLLHVQLHTAVVGEKAQAAQIDALLSELEVFVVNMFGAKSEQVTEFGFSPRKVPVLTAAQKAASKAKAAATRKAKKAALAAVGAPPAGATGASGTPVKA
jgi:hypothetical protein